MSRGTEAQRACWIRYERALKRGELIRDACQHCGDIKSQGHHEDYTKPLDVIWLCRRCHTKEHQRLGWGYKNPPRAKKGQGLGLKQTEETQAKKSESLKKYWATADRSTRKTARGQKRSDETRAKMREAQLGKKASPETIEKLRISHLGQKAWNKGLRKCT
jgi:hypothetical protein